MANMAFTNYSANPSQMIINTNSGDYLFHADMQKHIAEFYALIDNQPTIIQLMPILEKFKRSHILKYFMENPDHINVSTTLYNFVDQLQSMRFNDFPSKLAGLTITRIDLSHARIDNVSTIKVKINAQAARIPRIVFKVTQQQRERNLRRAYNNKKLVRIISLVNRNVTTGISNAVNITEDMRNAITKQLYLYEGVCQFGHEKNGYTMQPYYEKESIGNVK